MTMTTCHMSLIDSEEFTDFNLNNEYIMTDEELDELSEFLNDINKESFISVNTGCALSNIFLTMVNPSRIVRFGKVIREILSDYETRDFDMVRSKILSIKVSNSYRKTISRRMIHNLLISWDCIDILSYITQVVSNNSGINYKKVFDELMFNIKTCPLFNDIFEGKLIFSDIESNETESGFMLIE